MSEETFTAYVTKYALTAGIKAVVAHRTHFVGMIAAPELGRYTVFHGEGKDWHRSYDAAVIRAETMRADKIKSLKKSLAKLERLSFAKVEG